MGRVLPVIALVCVQACDAPWAGPNDPPGSQAVNVVLLSANGPVDSVAPDIIASASLVTVRDQVLAHAMGGKRTRDFVCAVNQYRPDPCWDQQIDRPGRVYFAVVTYGECNRAVKESSVLSGHTLYFIRWIGKPQGVCNAAMALPSWRLYYVSRKELPATSALTVRLQFQGDEHRNLDSKVVLS